MKRAILAILGALAVVAGILLPTATANASQTCTQANGAFQDYLPVGNTLYYLAAPNTINPGSSAVFHTANNASTFWIRCNATYNGKPATAFEFSFQGVFYALQNDNSDNTSIVFQPGFHTVSASQLWYYVAVGNTWTFQNVKSGRFMRAPNSGPSNFGPVVAGASASNWIQSP